MKGASFPMNTTEKLALLRAEDRKSVGRERV